MCDWLIYLFIWVRCWLRSQWPRTECTTVTSITEHVLTLQTYDTLTINKHKGLVLMASCVVGFQPFNCFFCFVFVFDLPNMCNTFTLHHKANRLVTQRHMVKTDVWLRWAWKETPLWFLISLSTQSISGEVIKVTPKPGLCQAPLSLERETRCKWRGRGVVWLSPSCGLGWNWCFR